MNTNSLRVTIRSRRDFWSGWMFIVIGLGFAWGALDYSFGSSAQPGPGYFPRGLGLVLALLGATILVRSLTARTADGDPVGATARKPVAIITGSFVLAGIALPWLGMLVALPLLVLISSLAGDEFHLGEVIVNATVLTVASWAIFSKGLSLTIPLLPAFLT